MMKLYNIFSYKCSIDGGTSFWNKFNFRNVVSLTGIIFSFCTVLYCYIIFQQFNLLQILSGSGLYVLFVFALAMTSGYKFEMIIARFSDIILALFLSFFLLLLMTIPLGIHHADYFRTFPILEAEQGVGTVLRGWYDDTVFHISIVQSILNFGYPSIGQHGTPLMVYHVITHYFDAFVLRLTGLDPFDSYGMFAVLKRYSFLSILCLFIFKVADKSRIYCLFGFFVFIPLSVDIWLPVISHGLWLPTIVFIATLPIVYNRLFKEEINSVADLLLFFSVAIVISLGKISFGFMYAAFIGFVLLLKQPRNISVYALGGLWLLFFYSYSLHMPIETSSTHGLNLNLLTFSRTANLISNSHWLAYSILFVALPFFFIYDNSTRRYTYFAFSGLVVILITIVVSVATSLGPADKTYFQLASYSILLSYAFVLCSNTLVKKHDKSGKNTIEIIRSFALVFLLLLYMVENYATFSDKLLERNREPFRIMNNTLMQPNLSILSSVRGWDKRGWFVSESGYFYTFKRNVYEMINKSEFSKAQSIIFIPKDVYKQLPHDYGNKWAAGMFLYSLTGVPLVNAIKDEPVRGYGIYLYDSNAYRKSAKEFSLIETCAIPRVRQVIIIEKFSPFVATRKNCSDNYDYKGENSW